MASWSLCIATLDRHDALSVCVGCALTQSRPPAEIVVVDASANWEEGREAILALVAGRPGIRLDYIESPVRSSAEQRNIAIRAATSDILFLFDDDSFMHPDCAEEILRIYEMDSAAKVAGVAAQNVPEHPSAIGTASLARKVSGRSGAGVVRTRLLHTNIGRWINRKVLLQSVDELFIRYDEPRSRSVPEELACLDILPLAFMGGCVMTVRRLVALKEPFEGSLRYYAAFEDLDVSYRYARHGALLLARRARLHHFEVAGGRVKRKKVIVFQLLNMLVFLKCQADRPERFVGTYRTMLWRRLLSETLKDVLSVRWSLPQARGVLVAMRHWREVWQRDCSELRVWYPQFQKTMLEAMK